MNSVLTALIFLTLGIALYFAKQANTLGKQLFSHLNNNPVTGLPNQHFLINTISDQENRPSFKSVSLIYIDLENFREINQVFGHEFGNRLIGDFALRIRLFLPPKSLLCHIGVDRFCLLFSHDIGTGTIESLCNNIRDSMNVPFKVHGYAVRLRLLFGYGSYHQRSGTFKKFLLQLEQMVQEQGSQSHHKTLAFTEQSGTEQNFRIRLKNDLKVAVDSGQFVPYFQPIINLNSGQIEKAEMLIRWRHPELGFVKPSDFIPLAEQTGSILQIGKWCRLQAIDHCKHWNQSLNRSIQISINMSPIELMDDGQDSSIRAFIDAAVNAGLPMDRFVLEITEGALVLDDPVSESKIKSIIAGGVDLSIDDFGTGFSSISYLNRFPISFLKLDISFVRNLSNQKSQQVICDHIIRMAHSLDILVIAEGIETEEQAQILRAFNCDYGQGYLYSAPIAASEFEQRFLIDTQPPALQNH